MNARACAFQVKSGGTKWCTTASLGCTSMAEDGSRYCPAHRGGVEVKRTTRHRDKRDLTLDVLPWTEKSFGGE